MITLLGDSDHKETAPVGNSSYEFPVTEVKSYHLWKIEERVIIHNDLALIIILVAVSIAAEITRGTRQGIVIQEVK